MCRFRAGARCSAVAATIETARRRPRTHIKFKFFCCWLISRVSRSCDWRYVAWRSGVNSSRVDGVNRCVTERISPVLTPLVVERQKCLAYEV